MKILYLVLFLFTTTPVIAEDDAFKMFDNYDFFKNEKKVIILDGKLSDTCLDISRAFETLLYRKGGLPEKLDLMKPLKPTLDFIKFCYEKGLLKE